MTRWHITETQDLVLAKFGRDQLELVRPCLQSVCARQWYAGYHYHEARRLLDSFVSARLTNASLIEVVFGQDTEAADEFNRFLMEAGAHVLACVQSMHATADILSHVVYLSLGINLSTQPIAEWNVSLTTVVARLQQEATASAIYALLNDISSGGSFAHLSALSNHGKHRSVVRPSLTEDWTGAAPDRHTLKIPSFIYKKKRYPEVAVKDFLEPEYDRCKRLVVNTGNALNGFLRT